jgi:hypothetical protein
MYRDAVKEITHPGAVAEVVGAREHDGERRRRVAYLAERGAQPGLVVVSVVEHRRRRPPGEPPVAHHH